MVVNPPVAPASLKRCCKIDRVEVVNGSDTITITPSVRRGPGGCCVLVLTVTEPN